MSKYIHPRWISHIRLPEHIENFSFWIYAHENIWNCDELKFSIFGVGKVNFWFPNGLNEFGIVEVQRLINVNMIKPDIDPCLQQVQVHLVVLLEEMSVEINDVWLFFKDHARRRMIIQSENTTLPIIFMTFSFSIIYSNITMVFYVDMLEQ